MLSTTLEEGLKAYAIGPKIRAIRLKRKMGLVELGRHTGLSPALLSKIERGQMFPTLPTLLRIALVFSVGLDYFFAAAREKPIVGVARHKDRLRFPETQGARDVAYEFESLDFTGGRAAPQQLLRGLLPRPGLTSSDRTSTRARSSSTCCPERSASTSGKTSTCSRHATPFTSTRRRRTRIAAAERSRVRGLS